MEDRNRGDGGDLSRPAQRLRAVLPTLLVALVAWAAWGGWLRWQATNVGSDLAQRAKPGDIVMLASATCPYCEQARRYFQAHGVSFSECVIERDEACARQYAATGAQGTPTFVVRGSQWQLGFDARRLAEALDGRAKPLP
jgi:glutaredoxin